MEATDWFLSPYEDKYTGKKSPVERMKQLEKEFVGKAQPDYRQDGMTLGLHGVYLPTAKQWKSFDADIAQRRT